MPCFGTGDRSRSGRAAHWLLPDQDQRLCLHRSPSCLALANHHPSFDPCDGKAHPADGRVETRSCDVQHATTSDERMGAVCLPNPARLRHSALPTAAVRRRPWPHKHEADRPSSGLSHWEERCLHSFKPAPADRTRQEHLPSYSWKSAPPIRGYVRGLCHCLPPDAGPLVEREDSWIFLIRKFSVKKSM